MKFLILFMLKAMSVTMRSWVKSWYSLRVSVMVVSSARLIVCLPGWDFKSKCVVVRVVGLITIDFGYRFFGDPSVYVKSQGFKAAWNCRIGYLLWLGVCGCISG
jgi:hypothetical protein